MTVEVHDVSDRYLDALALTHELHRRDTRKGGSIPYLSHLLSVSALVMEYGGTEDQAIAGLLHDAAEDHGGQSTIDAIRVRSGDEVADIVAACTDSLAEDPTRKQPWWPRKVAYLDHLETAAPSALLVSAADKLHNSRSILADYRTYGDDLWSRFNPDAGRMGSLWYYGQLADVFSARMSSGSLAGHLAEELQRTVSAIRDHAHSLGNDVDAELAAGRTEEARTRSSQQF